MASPCVAERVRTGSRREPVTYILRWYQGGIGVRRDTLLVSARLAGVRVHTPYLHEAIAEQEAACHAWRLMRSGLWGDVQALATHRWSWSWLTLRRELVPIGGERRG